MKKLINSVAFIGMFVLVTLCVSSCDENEENEKYCHDKGKLYCSDGRKGCCPQDTPWSDGHGACWGTVSDCRQTGWACSVCR